MAEHVSPGSEQVAANLSAAAHGGDEGMPHTGGKALTTAEGGPGQHHAEPALFGVMDATVWVSVAMAVFIGILIWKKVPGMITAGLDKQIAAIRTRLDEAKTLRAEAEALRDEYARRIAGIEAQAAEMIANADVEAKAVVARAEADAAELVQRRTRMAEDKIAAAERAAVTAVRAKAAEAATQAAASIIASKHGVDADKALVDRTISGLGRLN